MLNFCGHLPKRCFEANEVILKEGSKTNRLYVLISGGVEVRKDGVLLKATAEPGSVFGEISVLLNTPHVATVTTKVPSTLFEVVDAAAFIAENPGVSIILARLLAERLSALSTHFSGAKLIMDQLIDDPVGNTNRGGEALGYCDALQVEEGQSSVFDHYQELRQRYEDQGQSLEGQILERTRAERNLQQQFSRISLLNEITRGIAERQDFDSILNTVTRQLQCNLPLDFTAVLLIEDNKQVFKIAAVGERSRQQGPFNEVPEFSFEDAGLGSCLEGRTFYAKDTVCEVSRLFRLLSDAGLQSVVTVPLMVGQHPYGVLLGARRTADAFSSGECEFFRMLTDHVALAAHQARLYEQLQSAYEELKTTQQAVMQQERLSALGEMASGIAHDINNTLSPIVVYPEMILRSEKNLSEATRRELQTIKTAGEDIAHFVTRMRDFYRKREANEDLAVLSCNALLEQAVDLTRPRWRDIPMQRGVVIDLDLELASDVPDIEGNPAEFREAVTNLILNAVDAMPSGGKLTLRTRFERNIGQSRSGVVLEVTDTGTGMDEATRARCLEPFFSTKGQRGTGLGLAMVYGIVERHEGRIEIDSAIGKGTTMRLIFPAGVQDAPAQPVATEQPVSALRILYIDDEPLLRDLLKETLELDGHSVAVAEHGRAGLEVFRAAASARQPFNVVITDLGMPQMDGRQVAGTLKKESPQTPVVLLTGWGAMIKSNGDDAVEDVDAVISKPPRMNELRETLGRLAIN